MAESSILLPAGGQGVGEAKAGRRAGFLPIEGPEVAESHQGAGPEEGYASLLSVSDYDAGSGFCWLM